MTKFVPAGRYQWNGQYEDEERIQDIVIWADTFDIAYKECKYSLGLADKELVLISLVRGEDVSEESFEVEDPTIN